MDAAELSWTDTAQLSACKTRVILTLLLILHTVSESSVYFVSFFTAKKKNMILNNIVYHKAWIHRCIYFEQ